MPNSKAKTPRSVPTRGGCGSKKLVDGNVSKWGFEGNSRKPISRLGDRSKENRNRVEQRKPSWKSGSNGVDLLHKGDSCRKLACGSAPLLQKKVKKVVAKAGVRGDVARLGNGDGLERVINGDGDGVGGDSVPPVEASVSPEVVQCEPSSGVSCTPGLDCGTCHAIFAVKSKKKCRPRGVLVVDDSGVSGSGKVGMFDDVDKESVEDLLDDYKSCRVPSPVEALLYWHTSCDDEKGNENKEDGVEGVCNGAASFKGLESECSSPSSFHDFSSQSRNISDSTNGASGATTRTTTTTSYLSSGHGNVIRTPQSDSSSDHCVIMSPINEHEIFQLQAECDLDTAEEPWRHSSSPENHISTEVVGSRFQLDYMNNSSDSYHLHEFQNALDSQSTSVSDSVLADLLETELKISWKDDAVSQDNEMDDLDFCRCFSDEEEESKGLSWSKPCPLPDRSESINVQTKIDTKCDEHFTSEISNDCAESMSWSQCSMLASGDSESIIPSFKM